MLPLISVSLSAESAGAGKSDRSQAGKVPSENTEQSDYWHLRERERNRSHFDHKPETSKAEKGNSTAVALERAARTLHVLQFNSEETLLKRTRP